MGPASNIAEALLASKSTVSKASHIQKGYLAELQALAYLKSQGFLFWAHNFKTPFSQVDLLMEKDEVLFLVEVKTLKSFDYLPRRVSEKQKRRLERALSYLVIELEKEIRIIWAFVLNDGRVFILDDSY